MAIVNQRVLALVVTAISLVGAGCQTETTVLLAGCSDPAPAIVRGTLTQLAAGRDGNAMLIVTDAEGNDTAVRADVKSKTDLLKLTGQQIAVGGKLLKGDLLVPDLKDGQGNALKGFRAVAALSEIDGDPSVGIKLESARYLDPCDTTSTR